MRQARGHPQVSGLHLCAQSAWPCSAAAPRHAEQKHHPPCPCTADVEAYAFALAANMGFRRLFGYIDGQNEEAVKIPVRQAGRAAEWGSTLGPLRFTGVLRSFLAAV